MVIPHNTMSLAGQHALEDMVEFEMYLLAKPQRTAWPMLPRGSRKLYGARKPYSNVVEWMAANELLDQGLIEATSTRTFVKSKSGHQFYERAMKRRSA
jgi:hypothetical protein